MIVRRGLHTCFGLAVFLVALTALYVPSAPAATASLEWDPPTYNFGQVPYDSGPSKPHEFILTNTGETQLVTKHWRSSWVAYWPEAPDPF